MSMRKNSPASPKPTSRSRESSRSPSVTDLKDHSKAKRTLCRNILLYGSCKHSENGCAFRHDGPFIPSSENLEQYSVKKKLNAASASFQPVRALPVKAAGAAVFVPKSQEKSLFLSRERTPVALSPGSHAINPYNNASMLVNEPFHDDSGVYYTRQNQFKPTLYNLYNPQPSPMPTLLPYERTVNGLFIDDTTRERIERKSEASRQTISALPSIISSYTSLAPLNTKLYRYKEQIGFSSWTYKCTSSIDGNAYVLKRLQDCSINIDTSTVDKLKNVFHPNIVPFHSAFHTDTFHDSSLLLIYDFYPCTTTLGELYLNNSKNSVKLEENRKIPERELWNYFFQLTIALSYLHKSGFACNKLTPSRILVDQTERIRISGCADYELVVSNKPPLEERKKQDFVDLGVVIANLATGRTDMDMSSAARAIYSTYSREFYKAVLYFVSEVPEDKNLELFLQNHIESFFPIMSSPYVECEKMERKISDAFQHGRFFNILCKIMFIIDNNRASREYPIAREKEISLIYLLRDYLFHQIDEDECPVIDLYQVLNRLGKLDAGINQAIALISRDELDCVSVSYGELKAWLDNVYEMEINS
ncbi:PAN2-PAN3 deadenylation complex subunit pan3 [Schizosaccharomyces pombe]